MINFIISVAVAPGVIECDMSKVPLGKKHYSQCSSHIPNYLL
jgi:hypothetical protein